jgi:hypothetical protein
MSLSKTALARDLMQCDPFVFSMSHKTRPISLHDLIEKYQDTISRMNADGAEPWRLAGEGE